MCHDIITFSYSDHLKSFSFSAKNTEIVFPETVKVMSDEELEIIKKFCIVVRKSYLDKVVQFNVQNVGKKICPIQLKHIAIQEAICEMRKMLTADVFDPIYSQFQQLQNTTKRKSFKAPKQRKETLLDMIESATDIL